MKIFSFFFLVCLPFLVGEMFSQTLWTVIPEEDFTGAWRPQTCSTGITWDSIRNEIVSCISGVLKNM